MAEELKLDFSDLSAYLQSVNRWVDQEWSAYLPLGDPERYLYKLAREYPCRGGKRLRPSLLWLSNAYGGGRAEDAVPSAMALELFQNFALVHDDIEDSSLIRRGHPTLHRRYGIPLALNAGDLLLELAFESLLKNVSRLGEGLSSRLLELFCKLVRNTLEGQAMDIGWRDEHYFPDRKELQDMMLKKTGWYSGRGPCEMGVLVAGGGSLGQALGDYGESFALGFQLCDDILNLSLESATRSDYGKEHGGDFAEGKRTLIGLEMSERLDSQSAERLKRLLCLPRAEKSDLDIEWAVAEAHRCGAIRAVAEKCQLLFEQALSSLPTGEDHQAVRLLKDLVLSWQAKLPSF